MNFSNLFQSKRLTQYLSTFGLAAAALLIGSASVSAQSNCRNISGRFQEHSVSGPNCLSPVGLCIEAEYTAGPLHGTFTGSVNSLIPPTAPPANPPAPNVLFFTTDTLIHAQVKGKQGDIFVKNSGVFQTVAPGAIMDIQYITGGNGDFAGVSGVIQAYGTFDGATGLGESEYVGTICLP